MQISGKQIIPGKMKIVYTAELVIYHITSTYQLSNLCSFNFETIVITCKSVSKR